ncbi:hypothetical protein CLS_26970 [[Clostridium] cf. saccharolyticum K10]|nr:hypothetical protein CLS_26970 [[Clostridium] cf. saccharolyticum K10]
MIAFLFFFFFHHTTFCKKIMPLCTDFFAGPGAPLLQGLLTA